jgi:fructose-1,6-bisphosphatase
VLVTRLTLLLLLLLLSLLLVSLHAQGTHGFTLDHLTGEYVLTHPNMTIPARGQIYRCGSCLNLPNSKP